MGFKCGIVGLPNVGKSTLFNALTASKNAEAANFPFCTIDPNIGIVDVIDERLDYLAKLSNSKKKIYAIKPLTFMNNSGTAIKELIDYFKIDAKNVIVFHDDMDIDFGKIKAKFGGSSAGHNGIESIDKFIGKEYSRVRIGIGHPKQKKKVNNHVLEDFKEDEEEKIKEITENIVKQIPTLIDKNMDLFSSKVNQNLNGI